MANEIPFELINPSDLGIDTDLGGTARLFEIEAVSKFRKRVRVGDKHGHTAMVEQLFSPESLFEVTYDFGAKATYNYSGELQKLVIPFGVYFGSLDEGSREKLDPEFLEAVGGLLEAGTEITAEIDMRDGLAENDGTGWVQLVCDPYGMEKLDQGVGGFEIGPGVIREEQYTVLISDEIGGELGRVFMTVEVRGDQLYVALGDGKRLSVTRYFLRVNPDWVGLIGTPAGALRLLTSLRPQPKSL